MYILRRNIVLVLLKIQLNQEFMSSKFNKCPVKLQPMKIRVVSRNYSKFQYWVSLIVQCDCFVLNILWVLWDIHFLVELDMQESVRFNFRYVCFWPRLLPSYIFSLGSLSKVKRKIWCDFANELNFHREGSFQFDIILQSDFDCLIH